MTQMTRFFSSRRSPSRSPVQPRQRRRQPRREGVASMSQEQKIKLALNAAPRHIAKDAGVVLPGEDGKLVEVKPSGNGFKCIPTVNNGPDPDPMCFDTAVGQWVESLLNKAEKPTNTVPGISYMARGGYHWEKDENFDGSGSWRQACQRTATLD